ncbi:MAG: metal-sensing transcriptional repressor [Candidatus Gastranaerophilaceae bacterium]
MHADKKKLTTLLRTARGQIEGILKMIEEDRECMDVSTQLLATQSILKKVNMEILSCHISHCVRETFEKSDEAKKQEEIAEIIKIINKLSK